MRYSVLVALLVLLNHHCPIEDESEEIHFQEDCAGAGLLSAGVRQFGLRALKRDVPWFTVGALVKTRNMFQTGPKCMLLHGPTSDFAGSFIASPRCRRGFVQCWA